jgi:hypothetical protein
MNAGEDVNDPIVQDAPSVRASSILANQGNINVRIEEKGKATREL